MTQYLVISGHPDLKASHTNTVILNELQERLPAVEIRRLDALYPDYQIDIEAEQRALIAAGVVILQFPFYWYAMPALLKKWLDDVFSYNFAYGSQGDKLKDKHLIVSTTIGGPEESYTPQGYNHFSIEQLLRPLEQTAYLSGMVYHKPVYTHQMVYISGIYNTLESVQERARHHATRLIQYLMATVDSNEQRISRFASQWFEQFDQLPENPAFFTDKLSEDIRWVMPEGAFDGHTGFRHWYEGARKTFKPGCSHAIEAVNVSSTYQGYQADLRIRLLAETYEQSAFNGDAIDMLVNETWQLQVDDQRNILITDYQVTPIAA